MTEETSFQIGAIISVVLSTTLSVIIWSCCYETFCFFSFSSALFPSPPPDEEEASGPEEAGVGSAEDPEVPRQEVPPVAAGSVGAAAPVQTGRPPATPSNSGDPPGQVPGPQLEVAGPMLEVAGPVLEVEAS